MSVKMNVPQLRFGEFSGEWEEEKIGDIFNLYNGYAFSSNDSSSEGIRWVKIADVGIQKMKSDNISYLPSSFSKKYENFLLHEGDYVVALTRPILNGKLKIAQITKDFDGSLLNQRVGKLLTTNIYSFVYSLLQRNKVIDLIDKNILGTEPPNLSINQIYSLKISIPPKPEQEKIASFLSAVDAKIEGLVCKGQLLEEYKKGLMQRLFSQELRFKDDDGSEFPEWVERKLGEVSTFTKGKGISKEDITQNGNIACIRYGELYTHYNETINETISKTNLNVQDLVMSQSNDIIIPSSGETAIDIATASCVTGDNIALGGDLNIIRTKQNGIFLAYYLNNAKKHKIAKLAQGSSVIHLYSTHLKDLKLELPSLKEQTKIANFLSAIDTKISQTQTQLDTTKEFKKALLQQMFV